MEVNIYEMLEEKEILQYYEKKLGIDEYKIFQQCLPEDVSDKALSFLVSSVFSYTVGAPDLGNALMRLYLFKYKDDSKKLLIEQCERLNYNLENLYNELTIQLLCFAVIGYEMYKTLKTKDWLKDSVRFIATMFSSKQVDKFVYSLIYRKVETIRWYYMSSITLIIYYMMICDKNKLEYPITELQKTAKYIVRDMYKRCPDWLDCFICPIGTFIKGNGKYNCLYEILKDCNSTLKIKEFLLQNNHFKYVVLDEILEYYFSNENINELLLEIEEFQELIKEDTDVK